MAKYLVYATVTVPIGVAVPVEAKDALAASRAARKALVEDPKYKLLDFDGNNVEIQPDDIAITSIEKD